MGKDAQGHGHDAGTPGNPYHGKHGEFTDGSGAGADETAHHAGEAAVQKALLNKSGNLKKSLQKAGGKPKWSKPHVTLDLKATAARLAGRGDHQAAQTHNGRGYPVAPHSGKPSVGTHASEGGGGSGGGSVGGGSSGRFSIKKTTKGLRKAAQEKVAMNKAIDARHFPSGDEGQQIALGMVRGVPRGK